MFSSLRGAQQLSLRPLPVRLNARTSIEQVVKSCVAMIALDLREQNRGQVKN